MSAMCPRPATFKIDDPMAAIACHVLHRGPSVASPEPGVSNAIALEFRDSDSLAHAQGAPKDDTASDR